MRAERFGWEEVARTAELLHDIGKASVQFQNYIQRNASQGGDHSTAGALAAAQVCPDPLARLLALVIAGHHSDLADPDEIERRLGSTLPGLKGWEAYTGPLPPPQMLKPTRPTPPPGLRWLHPSFSLAFVTRMLFSCLVDADFIATETFMQGGPPQRGGATELATLRNRFGTICAS